VPTAVPRRGRPNGPAWWEGWTSYARNCAILERDGQYKFISYGNRL
jgi:hypothetical protein